MLFCPLACIRQWQARSQNNSLIFHSRFFLLWRALFSSTFQFISGFISWLGSSAPRAAGFALQGRARAPTSRCAFSHTILTSDIFLPGMLIIIIGTVSFFFLPVSFCPVIGWGQLWRSAPCACSCPPPSFFLWLLFGSRSPPSSRPAL